MYTFLSILLFFILVSFVIRFWFVDTMYKPKPPSKHRLKKEGLVLLPKLLSDTDIHNIDKDIDEDNIIKAKRYIMTSKKVRKMMDDMLGKDYIFQDYIFLIKQSQFHTCHRDYNGDLFNPEQNKPSYTIIFYLTDMGTCLDVLPKSHLSMEHNYNFSDYTKTVPCKKGDAILFNANLVHNGSLTDTENNTRIQMKITHKSDLKALHFYTNYNKVLDTPNTTPMIYKHVQKHVTCQFPVISKYVKQFDNNKTDNPSTFSSFFSPFFATLRTVQ
jgi:hypothetical protein